MLWKLAQTEPQTIAGARALLEHVAAYENGCMSQAELHCTAVLTVAGALAKMEARNG